MAYPRALGKARQIVENVTLNTTALIYRRSQVADDSGGQTDTYTVYRSGVPCSFEATQITPVEREDAVTVRAQSVWKFVFPYGTDIRQTDRIVTAGRTFEVTSAASGSLTTSKRVLCTEIT